jgi:4-hydroxy-tetrahydrodipicolinate synthase
MIFRFQGIWVPLITPFHHGRIDVPALQKLVRYLREAGVAGVVVCGSTGEAAALSETEQLQVLDTVIDAAPGFPVAIGLSGNNLDDVHARLAEIQKRNIVGLLVPAPYYIRPSQAGVCAYFESIANASRVPVILYNIPYRTGVAMTLETLRKLAQHPNIVAIKDCGGDANLTAQLIIDGELAVMAGEDVQIFSTMCFGGAGAIAASAHLHPALFVKLANWIQDDKLHQARALFHQLLPLIQLVFADANPGPVKAALAHLGLAQNELREPMQCASEQVAANLIAELHRLQNILD